MNNAFPQTWCPQCLAALQSLRTGMSCSTCGKEYPIADGVLDLAPSQGYAYRLQSLGADTMQALLASIRREGWASAYRQHLYQEFLGRKEPAGVRRQLRDLYLSLIGRQLRTSVRSVFCESHAYFWLLTSLPRDGSALDLGSGLGGISRVLARECRHVVAADATLERLQFSALRAATEGVRNIAFVRTPASMALPFANRTFDLVVLNGVLEWVPSSIIGDPVSVQRGLLVEVRRVLKENGQILVAIENRFGFMDLMGFPEGHTGLPWIGILPRSLGNLYSRALGRGPLRVTTHSAFGLIRLLRAAGFDEDKISLYAPVPGYAWYDTEGGFNRRAAQTLRPAGLSQYPSVRRRLTATRRIILRPLERCVGAFHAIAAKDNAEPVIRELLELIAQSAGIVIRRPVGPLRIRDTKVHFQVTKEDPTDSLWVLLGMNEEGSARVRNEVHVLMNVWNTQPVRESHLLVPRVLWCSEFRGHPVALLSCVPGQPLRACARLSEATKTTKRVLQILESVAREMRDQWILGDIWEQRWAFLRALAPSKELSEIISEVEAHTRPPKVVLDAIAPFGHGDLQPGNILHDTAAGTTGLIDWEVAGPRFPHEDQIMASVGHIRARYGAIGPTLVRLLQAPLDSSMSSLLLDLCPSAGGNPALLHTTLVAVWLSHIHNARGSHSIHNPAWLEERAWSVLRTLALQLGKHATNV